MALILGIITFVYSQKVNETLEESRTADAIVTGVFELNMLMNDYLLHVEERSKEQWQSRYNTLAELINADIFHEQEEQEFLEELQKCQTSIKTIFTKIITGREEGSISNELEERLASQLWVKSQTMVSIAFELGEETHGELLEQQQALSILAVVIISTLALIMIIGFLLIMRIIIGPITTFQKGAEIIGKGNFKHKKSSV